MGHFLGMGEKQFYVDDDGRVYNGPDKKTEYDSETFKPVINVPAVNTTVAPEHTNIDLLPDPVMDDGLFSDKLQFKDKSELRKIAGIHPDIKISKKELIRFIREKKDS